MSYDAKAIANYFIDLAEGNGEILTQMKLQKLVYFGHGWELGLTANPLIDELVQAWSYGPVIPSLYSEFREFGSGPITRRAVEFIRNTAKPGFSYQMHVSSIRDYVETDNKHTEELLVRVWDVYSKYSAGQLSTMTHAPGTPWDEINRKHEGHIPKNEVIPNDIIQAYFERRVKA